MSSSTTDRRTALKLLGALAGTAAAGSGVAAGNGSGGGPVFEVRRMVGNTLTGSDGAIRGVDAGGLPWVVDEAEVRLDADGHLKVEVEGLVVDPDADHPAAGTNPVDTFRAAVSCLTLNQNEDAHIIDTVQTGEYPASDDGDAEIEEDVTLADPCLAPLVFVTHPNGPWFAVTGV